MSDGIALIKKVIGEIESGLKDTIHAVAGEIGGLGTPCAGDYASAILDENEYSRDTAEIYFFHYNPDERHTTGDDVANYRAWVNEIERVQRILKRYGGTIEVDGLPLQDYLTSIDQAGVEGDQVPNHRVHVKITVPEQDELRLTRGVNEIIENYESAKND